MTMVETLAPQSIFSAEHSHYYGANVQGKPQEVPPQPGGQAEAARDPRRDDLDDRFQRRTGNLDGKRVAV